MTICLLPYIPIWLFSGSYINGHRRPILVCDECQKTFLILWVSIVLKLFASFIIYIHQAFSISLIFPFQCFQIFDGSLSLFMFAFQFVINVFNSMLLMCFSAWLFCDYFNYYFLIFCWCFLWGVFKLSTLCFCFLAFIFGISTFNILCSILQIFLFSSKMFPLFSTIVRSLIYRWCNNRDMATIYYPKNIRYVLKFFKFVRHSSYATWKIFYHQRL